MLPRFALPQIAVLLLITLCVLPACTTDDDVAATDAATDASQAGRGATDASTDAALDADARDVDAHVDAHVDASQLDGALSDASTDDSGASDGDGVVDGAGGVVDSSDGHVRLSVPAGALSTPTQLTITLVTPLDDAGAGELGSDVYELGPDGQAFAKDVELCIEGKSSVDASQACLGYQDENQRWRCEDTCLKPKDDKLCGSTNHFTSFAILLSTGSGAAASPASCEDAFIGSAGGSLTSPDGLAELQVPADALPKGARITIAEPGTDPDGLGSKIYELTPDGQSFASAVTLCLTPTSADTDESCLGYLDAKTDRWTCEDTCLTQKDDKLCGSTGHFTNFALLLSGGKGLTCSVGAAGL